MVCGTRKHKRKESGGGREVTWIKERERGVDEKRERLERCLTFLWRGTKRCPKERTGWRVVHIFLWWICH